MIKVLFFILFILAIIGMPFIIPKVVIWIALGLFNTDLSDKYWYIFWGWILLSMLFGGRVQVNKK